MASNTTVSYEGAVMEAGDRVTAVIKFNARSTDPVDGATCPADSFRLVKKGSAGTVESAEGGFAVVKFDGLRTRQQIRTGALRPAGV
jgi:hypothetical protein